MKRKYRQQTDAEHRERALKVLEKAKKQEAGKRLIPLRIGDNDNTVLLVSSRLNMRQREKLRQQKLSLLNKNRIHLEEEIKKHNKQ
ncbi:MAG TPA: hypothetical protein DIT04_07005 [Dysgonomonas sp.]|nr:hypothetical protein [Dysgonomonas sp.]